MGLELAEKFSNSQKVQLIKAIADLSYELYSVIDYPEVISVAINNLMNDGLRPKLLDDVLVFSERNGLINIEDDGDPLWYIDMAITVLMMSEKEYLESEGIFTAIHCFSEISISLDAHLFGKLPEYIEGMYIPGYIQKFGITS